MSQLIQMQIDNARNEIKVWNNFSEAVSKLDNDEVKKNGEERYQMVWESQEVDYFLDQSTAPLVDIFVSKKNGLLTKPIFYIPNSYLIEGKDKCLELIDTAIKKLEKEIDRDIKKIQITMNEVRITGVVTNDIPVPNSQKYSTDKENTFVYNVDGEFDEESQQAIRNTIESHGGKNGFTTLVTFNINL